ncbi:NUDIX hydrolase [Ruegeria sp. HKCCA5491]|uniref:NUDIX hydrolase n=1 Tax=Ruegeria sp. HKCCA5491 TaxID=2682986 RepID=UPI001488A0B2
MIEHRLWKQNQQLTGHGPVKRQSAALCYRVLENGPEVLLVTTRKSGRWIIPKGGLIDGLSPSATARQEAWEEAGAIGDCTPDVIGNFLYYKNRRRKGPVLCVVDVFPLLVRSTAAFYPECHERQRAWLSPQKAASRVRSPDLAQLLRKVALFAH